MVTKYEPNGDCLEWLMENFDDFHLRLKIRFLRHCLETLQKMHNKHGLVHGDVSLENMLITDELECQLFDFEYTYSHKKKKLMRLGKSCYMAPEIFHAPHVPKNYDPRKSDIFSLGICLFAFFFRALPFGNEKAISTNANYLIFLHTGKLPFLDKFKAKHPVIAKLIYDMIAINPERRPCAKEALRRCLAIQTTLKLPL